MSVDLFDRAMVALNAQDLEGFLAMMDRQVVGVPRLAAMEGVYRGYGGMSSWWDALFGAFPDLSAEVPERRELNADLTVASMRFKGRGAESGTPFDETVWHVAWWRNGKCTRWEIHGTEAEALEAAAAP